MISIRHFSDLDAAAMQQKCCPEMPVTDILDMIAKWETKSFQGKYFEMFAIIADHGIVGSISLYEHSKSVASIGVEVYPGDRGKGYAAEGMRLMMNHAGNLGYRVILNQVRADNQASIALHNSLEFETDGYTFKNEKGKEVLLYLFCL